MKANKERGFTLVEVLAALTILGIVFISYMMIFPQMVNMNERTETKLETMNVAKKELAIVKSRDYVLDPTKKIKEHTSQAKHETYELSKDDYYITLDCYSRDNQTCSNKEKNKRSPELYKIHIKVHKDTRLVSESFGYLPID